MNKEEVLILETLKLAKKGMGKVSPNPMVGAVIVKNGKIISRGYHHFFGDDHAEVNALKNAKNNVKESELYVNLEPCSHFGKTPPCVNEIVKAGIKRVIIGDKDLNPVVDGKGINYLKRHGVEVVYGVLTDKCRELNKGYYKYMRTGFPYVSVKIAQSIDGKISKKEGTETNITSAASKRIVHRLRSNYDAVLIGKNTAVIDNPSLTVRLCKGVSPKRIILDENLKIDSRLKILKKPLAEGTIIFTTSDYNGEMREVFLKRGIKIIPVKKDKKGLIDLKDMLRKSVKNGILSIIVEGGAEIFSSFINKKLVDKIYIFTAPKIYTEGVSMFNNSILDSSLKFEKVRKIGDDLFIEGILE